MPTEKIVASPEDFRQRCETLKASPRVGFDMEFVPEHTYSPELCLLQIATDDEVVAVDLLTVGDMTPFWEVVLDPERLVVVHAGSEELAACFLHTGQTPSNIVDVQLAAGLAGYGYPLSYESIVYKTVGTRVQSGETRTDWRKRPLTDRQLKYALDDVRCLLSACDHLMDKLSELGRSDWLRWEMEAIRHKIATRQNGERWRRIRGAGRLSRRELAVLRAVYTWREDRARSQDKPRGRIMRDDLLLEVAKRKPSNPDSLGQIRGMGDGGKSAWSKGLLQAVEHAMAMPDDDCPEKLQASPPADKQMVLKLASALASYIAREHSIAGELLATNSDLRDFVEWRVTGSDPEQVPRLATGWRGELCGARLNDLLAGRVKLSLAMTEAGDYEIVFEG